MAINSRSKGCRGEREAAAAIANALGVSARRGQQYHGGQDSPDVIADLPGVHWEVKRTEALSLYAALEQAIGDAGEQVPVVLHRRNRKPWVAIVRLDDLQQLADLLQAYHERMAMRKHRQCLKCNNSFLSDGPENRICNECRKENNKIPISQNEIDSQRGVKRHNGEIMEPVLD